MAETKKPPKVNLKQIDKIIAGYRGQKWALIPLAQEIQEQVGHIPPEVIPRIANALGLFPSQVQGVITFYAQLYTEPRGRNIVRVCRGTACHVRGGKTILKLVKQHLGIEEGQRDGVVGVHQGEMLPLLEAQPSIAAQLGEPAIHNGIQRVDPGEGLFVGSQIEAAVGDEVSGIGLQGSHRGP